ncbi:cell division suppressor protein YneA [Indiicoccus explosivorum]|uniref:cell division suppressor protein YneA n=1 Tax=Indiicoccus explosivorum TaxID=1917864 RepID=UPI00138FCF4C|nr:LysM peptidoglycan-binding domain-containing protein [Indiicoccus explosivorum]
MTIIQRNTYVVAFFIFILLLSVFAIYHGKPAEVRMSHLQIEKGDTLWSLSKEFRGGQPAEQWINSIMEANNLHTAEIKAGDTLLIPQDQLEFAPDAATQFAGDAR